MPLKTGMLVGVVGTDEIGVLIQIREASQTCVIKLNNGTLKKNVPLADVEEARDMTDTKEKKSPIRLVANSTLPASGSLSPLKKPGGLSVDVGMSPKKSQSLRLAVGDPVRARYKKGVKWFSGKIIRVRANGTFDVEYDDGDVEVKVEAACIEAVATKDRHDDESTTRKKTSPKSSSSEFVVGMKVKAQYQKGKNWFSGKIMKVHHDNSCDIRYDDGDTETRVLLKHIEVIKEISKKPLPKAKSSPARLELGDAVQARFKNGPKWFSGKIARARTDGTFDVEYDDGDVEIKVEASCIEAVKTKDRHDERPSICEETSSKASADEFAVGMKVKARYQKGANWFSGKIMKVHHDGSCDIRYDDGDTEARVLSKYIEMPKDSKESPTSTKASPSRLEVGDAVQARYKKGTKWFPGKIKSVHSDGTYDVRYDDGDVETRVIAAHIKPTHTDRDDHHISKAKKSPQHRHVDDFSVGDVVNARYKRGKKLFPGKIVKVRTDGTYDVRYDDGDVEMHVEASLIERSIDSARLNDSEPLKKNHAKELSVGDRIKANFKKEPKHKDVRKLFSGKITRVRTDGTFDIKYDDGDVEMHVERSFIEISDDEKSQSPPSKRTSLEVGESVKARYKRGIKWFSGKITRAHSDGTYDIKYEDGDVETRVEKTYIEAEPKKSDKEPATRKKGFEVGDKVSARYKNGQKWFPGKIAKARTDGTFDILYDDGDEETRMTSDRLEALEPTKPQVKSSKREGDDIFGSSDSSSNGKALKKLSVGDIVKANYKGKGTYQRAKIVRAHKNGTFDIEYDTGSAESRVASIDIKPTKRTTDSYSVSSSRHKDPHRKYRHHSSDSDGHKPKEEKTTSHRKKHESGSSSAESEKPLKKGMRVALKNGKNAKSKRVAVIKRVHSDGTCDLKYPEGDETPRVPSKRLQVCSDSEDSDTVSKRRHESAFMRNQKVLARWRRPSKLSKPRLVTNWQPATVVEIHSDGTYTIRYEEGDVEEDAPPESIKCAPNGSDSNSSDDSTSRTRRKKAKQKNNRGSDRVKNETLYLLEQLAMTLFEEGAMKKKPKLIITCEEESDSDNKSSSDGSSVTDWRPGKMDIDAIMLRLFGKSLLSSYRERFNEKDTKEEGKISKSKIILIIEDLCRDKAKSKQTTARVELGEDPSVKQMLTEWFDTHDDIQAHRKFSFDRFMLAFAYAKHRLGKVRIEQSITGTLEARFASHHEHQRQLELWQQKLGIRMFEILQRNFQDSALPAMIPSRVRVSELARIFDHITKNAAPNKPLAVHLQQLHLREHQTLLLSEFLCCYYQLYGSANHHGAARMDTLELRPIAFLASCFFSSGDPVCNRHGDLVRRLSVGRTSSQQDMIARFREVFEELMTSDSENTDGAISSSRLNAFAAKVVSDSVVLEPALALLRKRCATVSLIEIYATCGFVIDDLIAAPTVANAVAKLRMRVDVADVRRIIGLVRSLCLKILRFPNNADYWRIRTDSEAFQLKIGHFDGATNVLEAVGFVEYKKTHFELRGARMMDGSRVNSLAKATLEGLREKCVQLEGELSMFDGVESITTILERIVSERQRQNVMTTEEVEHVLKCLSLYIDNILRNPKDSRCWRIREANKAFQRQIGYLPFATDLMVAIGFDSIATSQGAVFVLRGTGVMDTSVTKADTSKSASLANFVFSRVSEQMEWFLWRRKQEIDHLQSDEVLLLEIVGSSLAKQSRTTQSRSSAGLMGQADLAMSTMYPYAKNAVHIFNTTSVQRSQIEMMKTVFDRLDADKDGSLEYEAYCQSSFDGKKQMTVGLEPLPVEGKMGFEDFVASLGPLLDHPFGAETTEQLNFDSMSLCEQVSSLVGRLRIQTSSVEAGAVLSAFIEFLCRIIQEPDKPERWYLDESSSMGKKILRVAAIRELMRLAGFVDGNDTTTSSGKFVLKPRQLRFKTTKASEQPDDELDVGTTTRLKTIACMAAGHWRGLKHPEISDIGAVSRAVGLMRNIAQWIKLVELILVCIENILKHPDDERFRQLNTSTATYASIVSSAQGGAELLLSVGFRETDTGKLILPLDVSLAILLARKLELEVGLSVMRSVSQLALHQDSQMVNRQLVHPSFADNNSGEEEVEYYKKKAHAAEVARQEQVKKNVQLARQLERASKAPVAHTSTFSTQRPQHISSTKLTKRMPVTNSSNRHASRQVTDQIENEILSPLSPRKSAFAEATPAKTRPSRGGAKVNQARRVNTSSKPLPSGNEKNSSWRPSTTLSTPSGRPLVLAMDTEAGASEIYATESSLIRRGMLLRIGSELPDLVEERVVIDVTAANGAIQGLSRILLAFSLRFYHPAKELIFLIPQEAAKVSENIREGDIQNFIRNNLVLGVVNAAIRLSDSRRSCDLTSLPPSGSQHFEPVFTVELLNSFELEGHFCMGPNTGFMSIWHCGHEKQFSISKVPIVAAITDHVSPRKLEVFFTAMALESGASNATIRTADAIRFIERNPYLSILFGCSLHTNTKMKSEFGRSICYEDLIQWIDEPPFTEEIYPDSTTEETLDLISPLTYLQKHFRVMASNVQNRRDGFQCVDFKSLLTRIERDLQQNPPSISDDPTENQHELGRMNLFCAMLRTGFANSKFDEVHWSELEYFARYQLPLSSPEVFPIQSRYLLASSEQILDEDSPIKTERKAAQNPVLEVIAGQWRPLVFVLFCDGCLETWSVDPLPKRLIQTIVLIPSKFTSKQEDSPAEHQPERQNDDRFSSSWMDELAQCSRDPVRKSRLQSRVTSAVRAWNQEFGPKGKLLRLCAWDTILCVNSTCLLTGASQGSEGLSFFRVSDQIFPIHKMVLEHTSISDTSPPNQQKQRGQSKKAVSSSGILSTFDMTPDGTSTVCITGSHPLVLWVARAASGEILGYIDRFALETRASLSFQIIANSRICNGTAPAWRIIANSTSLGSHIGVWEIPQEKQGKLRHQVQLKPSEGSSIKSTLSTDSLSVNRGFAFAVSKPNKVQVWTVRGDLPARDILPIASFQLDPGDRKRRWSIESISTSSFDSDNELEPGVRNTSLIVVEPDAGASFREWDSRIPSNATRLMMYVFDNGQVLSVPVASFDLRMIRLDDISFDWDFFVSCGASARLVSDGISSFDRVVLQKQSLVRVGCFVCIHLRDGVFAQKSMQELLSDLESNAILWKTQCHFEHFAKAYAESVRLELRSFYRANDSIDCEIERYPQRQLPDPGDKSMSTLLLNALVRDEKTNSKELHMWKFARDTLSYAGNSSVMNQELVGSTHEADLVNAQNALALKSSLEIEISRLQRVRNEDRRHRIRKSVARQRESLIGTMKANLEALVHGKLSAECVADNLLKTLQVLCLLSVSESQHLIAIEEWCRSLFHSVLTREATNEASPRGEHVPVRDLVQSIRSSRSANAFFSAWMDRFLGKLQSINESSTGKALTTIHWNEVQLILRRIQKCSMTIEQVCVLISQMDQTAVGSGRDDGLAFAECYSEVINFMRKNGLDMDPDNVLFVPLSTVVEFLIQRNSVMERFRETLEAMKAHVSHIRQRPLETYSPEQIYSLTMSGSRWQRQLAGLEECQLSLSTSDEMQPASLYQPSVTAAQQLKQLLRTPLPQTAPIAISAVVISNDSSQTRILRRMVFEATGKLGHDARSSLPLTLICAFATSGDDAPGLQQELMILQKLQRWRARELFMPVCWSALAAPVIPSQQASHMNMGRFNEGHLIVAHSLYGWVSLKDCIRCMQIPGLSLLNWRTMISFWSRQLILMVIALKSESFQLSSIAFDSLLVSHDGSELRMASLETGRLVQEQCCSTEGTLVVGEFILRLLSHFSTQTSEHDTNASFIIEESDRLIAKRRRVLEVLASVIGCDTQDCALSLTELSRPCDILTFQTSHVPPEIVALVKAALLAFQKPTDRPPLEAVWGLLLSEETHSEPLRSEASDMMNLVRLQTIYEDKVFSVLSRYERSRKRRHVDSVRLGLLSWMDLLQQLFAMTNHPGKTIDGSTQRIFSFLMKRLVDDHIVARYAAIATDAFASSSSHNGAEETVQVLLKALRSVFELVNEAFECIQHINVESMELVVALVEQIVHVLCCIANGHQSGLPVRSTDCASCSRYSVSTCAVLWRLCESTFSELMSLETAQAPYSALLVFLKACKPSKWGVFGSAKNGDCALWWNSSENALPQRLSQQELIAQSHSDGVLSYEYLSVVHQTLEVAFKITSGVAVPKFRLTALQEWFSSAFLERKVCAPMIFVHEQVALVWKDLNFADFLRQSLRDHDLSMVFGALSLMECATRVLRVHPIKTPIAARSSTTNANQSLLKHGFASRAGEFALSLCSHRMIVELMDLLSTTTRALMMIGESGCASVSARSRNSTPLVSVLNVLCSLLVSMLHAGDAATQHWAPAGLLHFILTHAKGNALAFVKVHDSNMVDDLYHHRNRWIQQREPSHWTVFEFSHGSTSVSPFRCLLAEIMAMAGPTSVFLLQALMLSPYFAQEASSSATGKHLVQQTDLFCHPGYGSVSHAYDLAIDLRACNGTLDEVVQLITYAKALFLMLKASAQSCVSAFPRLVVELWRWMEATWTSLIAGVKATAQYQMQKQSEVVVAGFALLHAITTHNSLTVDELVEITTFVSTLSSRKRDRVSAFDVLLTGLCASLDRLDAADEHDTEDASQVSLLQTVSRCALHVLVSTLDTPNASIVTAIVDQCVDVELVVELLDRAPSSNVLSLETKQQLWRCVLHIHSQCLTMQLLESAFMERVVFSRLASDATTDRRLEGVMFLEVLVTVSSSHWSSSNTQLLFSKVCKLLLHHCLVPKEAERLRSQAQSSDSKAIHVTKRLMQLVCCLCVDFVAQSPDAVFVEQLAAVSIPLDVIAYHQRSEPKFMSEMGVTLFWSNWDGGRSGRSSAGSPAVASTNLQKRSQPRRALVHFALPDAETSDRPLMSDPQKPMRSLSRKIVDSKHRLSRVARPIDVPPTRTETPSLTISPVKAQAAPERRSLVHALLSIDMESAQAIDQRIKTRSKEDVAAAASGSRRDARGKRPEVAVGDDESLDLDAYSPFTSSSETKTPPRRNESDQKSRTGQRPREETKQRKRSRDISSSSSSSSEEDEPTPPRRLKPAPPDTVVQLPSADARLRRVFAKYDVDGDGEISFVDLRTALNRQRLSNVEIQKWITDKDRRGCGRVCFADFARAFASDAS